ncbi:class I SAM-dependent methyltransferase [Silvimonas sp. JCM 19000]
MGSINFGNTAEDYRRYRAGFPIEFFTQAAAHGVGLAGQQILDIGTGTGTLARGFAQRGAQVIGMDPATALLEQAVGMAQEEGVHVDFRVGRAEQTGLADASLDVVSAGQCWHWFDRPAAAQEAWRVLRRGGTLMMAHFDWLPLPGNVVAATEDLILKYNPGWSAAGGSGIHPRWFADLATAGFSGIQSFSFDLPVYYSPKAWRGRIRASAGVAASLDAETVARFDAALAALLQTNFPGPQLLTPHRVFAVWGRKYPAE